MKGKQASNDDNLKFSKKGQTRTPVYTLDQRRKMVQTEDVLQSQVESYLKETGWVTSGKISDHKGLIKGVYCHVPNQAFGSIRAKGLVGNYLKNLPDLMLFHPDGRYLFIELKSRSGKRMKGQRALAKILPISEGKVLDDVLMEIEGWYLNIDEATKR